MTQRAPFTTAPVAHHTDGVEIPQLIAALDAKVPLGMVAPAAVVVEGPAQRLRSQVLRVVNLRWANPHQEVPMEE